jgi:hypothetical protein
VRIATKHRFKLGGVASTVGAGRLPTSARRGAMKIPSGRRKQQQPGKIGFAKAEWQLAQIITVEREQIERVKLNLGIMLTGMQSTEIGHPVDAEQHPLGINKSGAD